MAQPWALRGLPTAVLAIVIGYAAARLVAARRAGGLADPMADAAHGLMAAGMAAVVLAGGAVPRVWLQGAFCALALWLVTARLGHVRPETAGPRLPGSHHGHHLAASLAMAYLVAGPTADAGRSAGEMAGMYTRPVRPRCRCR
jgi:hypothetical protein